MSENQKIKVFLCHSKYDKPKVRELYRQLNSDGFDAWLDEEKLQPGQDWDLEIRKAVRGSDVVIVCLSNNSTTKAGYVQKEIGFALDVADEQPEGAIFIIPVRLEDCLVPNRLSRWQWVNLYDHGAYEKIKSSLQLRIKFNYPVIKADNNEPIKSEFRQAIGQTKNWRRMFTPKIPISFQRKNSLFSGDDLIKIGIWGPPGCGKTTFLIMLQYADRDGWKIRPMGEETQEKFLEGSDDLRDRLLFPQATLPDSISYWNLGVTPPNSRSRGFSVVVPEASGEYYDKPKRYPEFLDEISRCHGILWLIDPERIDSPHANMRSYRSMIQEWLFRLHDKQGGGTLKQYMAFCLTKMDNPSHAPYLSDPINYCLDKLGQDVEMLLQNYSDISKVNFFATSSIGFNKEENRSNIDPNNPSKLQYPAAPINLFKPFQWLFNSI